MVGRGLFSWQTASSRRRLWELDLRGSPCDSKSCLPSGRLDGSYGEVTGPALPASFPLVSAQLGTQDSAQLFPLPTWLCCPPQLSWGAPPSSHCSPLDSSPHSACLASQSPNGLLGSFVWASPSLSVCIKCQTSGNVENTSAGPSPGAVAVSSAWWADTSVPLKLRVLGSSWSLALTIPAYPADTH